MHSWRWTDSVIKNWCVSCLKIEIKLLKNRFEFRFWAVADASVSHQFAFYLFIDVKREKKTLNPFWMKLFLKQPLSENERVTITYGLLIAVEMIHLKWPTAMGRSCHWNRKQALINNNSNNNRNNSSTTPKRIVQQFICFSFFFVFSSFDCFFCASANLRILYSLGSYVSHIDIIFTYRYILVD